MRAPSTSATLAALFSHAERAKSALPTAGNRGPSSARTTPFAAMLASHVASAAPASRATSTDHAADDERPTDAISAGADAGAADASVDSADDVHDRAEPPAVNAPPAATTGALGSDAVVSNELLAAVAATLAPAGPATADTRPAPTAPAVPAAAVAEPATAASTLRPTTSTSASASARGASTTSSVRHASRDEESLTPALRTRLARVVDRMQREHGHTVQIAEAGRTQERQDYLYEQGRTRSGPVVTWTRDSAHTRGRAVDVTIDGSYDDPTAFAMLQQVARSEGLRTLGTRDPGHLELPRDVPGEIRPFASDDVGPRVTVESIGVRTELASDVANAVPERLRTVPPAVPAMPTVVPGAVAAPAPVAAVAFVAPVAAVAQVASVATPGSSGAAPAVRPTPAQASTRAPLDVATRSAAPRVIQPMAGAPSSVAALASAPTLPEAFAAGLPAAPRPVPTATAPAPSAGAAPLAPAAQTATVRERTARDDAGAADASPARAGATRTFDPAVTAARARAESDGRGADDRSADQESARERATQDAPDVIATGPADAATIGAPAPAVSGPTAPLTNAAAATTPAAGPVLGAVAAERLARVLDAQQAAAPRTVSHLTLRVERAEGGEDRIHLDLRGRAVDARIDVADLSTADQLNARAPELRAALAQHGLTTDDVRVRSAGATAADARLQIDAQRSATAADRASARGASSTAMPAADGVADTGVTATAGNDGAGRTGAGSFGASTQQQQQHAGDSAARDAARDGAREQPRDPSGSRESGARERGSDDRGSSERAPRDGGASAERRSGDRRQDRRPAPDAFLDPAAARTVGRRSR